MRSKIVWLRQCKYLTTDETTQEMREIKREREKRDRQTEKERYKET